MLLLPGFGKKHAAVLLLGVAAVAVGWSLSSRPKQPATNLERGQGAIDPLSVTKPVTMEDYRSAVGEADKAFVGGDVIAASVLLRALSEIRVPREGMAAHEELMTAVASYRDALALDDGPAVAAALVRLRSFVQANPWCGLRP